MSYFLFLDDIRIPSDVTWCDWRKNNLKIITIRTVNDFRQCLNERGIPEHISFDYDLYNWDGTGLDCARLFAEFVENNDIHLPDNFHYYVHSLNDKGAYSIRDFMVNFLEKRKAEGKFNGLTIPTNITNFSGMTLY